MLRGRNILYLKDVLIISITAFGGPQVHLSMMLDLFVKKRNFLTEEELMEMVAFCSMLPGPSSTQIITAISLKRGGTVLAILALLIWILPATIIMTALTLGFTMIEQRGFSLNFLQFVQPLAIGIIAYAGFRIGTAVVKNYTGIVIMLMALLTSVVFTSPWIFPIVLILSGVITNFTNHTRFPPLKDRPKINWRSSSLSLALLLGIFLLAAVFGAITKFRPVVLFENFIRFGTITYGGGQVLVPMLFEQFVKHRSYLTANEFISGYALNQAVPGPSFAFATYTGGMAMKNFGLHYQLLGCFIGTVGIFLPSILLMFFIYPFWHYLKSYRFIKRSLEGVNAAATGLVLGAAVVLWSSLEFFWINIAVVVTVFLLLLLTKIQPPVLVALALVTGFLYSRFM